MRKTAIISIVLFLAPWLVTYSAEKEFTLPTGLKYKTEVQEYAWRWFVLPSGLKFWVPEVVQASEKSEKEVIQDYIWFLNGTHGVSAKMIENVVRCESNFNPRAIGDKGKAYGVLQFWRKTFDLFKDEANMEQLKYEAWKNQIDLGYWAFGHDKREHWVCYTKLYK